MEWPPEAQVPTWARLLKSYFTKPPNCVMYFLSMIVFYMAQIVNLSNAVLSFVNGDMQSFALLVFGIVAPGLVVAASAYPRMRLSPSTRDKAFSHSLRLALNMDRAVDALNYLVYKIAPRWDNVAALAQTELAFCKFPTLAGNFYSAISGSLQPGLNTYLTLASSVSAIAAALMTHKSMHIDNGPPGNPDKYRLFDVNAPNAVQQMIGVLVLESSCIMYRLGMFCILYVSASWPETLAFLICSCCFQFILAYETFARLPIPPKIVYFSTCGIVFRTVVADIAFYPIAASELMSRRHATFRLFQTSIAICMVAQHHKVLWAYPQQIGVWLVTVSTALCFLIWLISTKLVYYGMFAKAREEKRLIAFDFFCMLEQKKRSSRDQVAAAATPPPEKELSQSTVSGEIIVDV